MGTNSTLDGTFHALADGTRRTMVQVLARRGPQSAGELGARFASAQPTISKHLKVLEEAGLVERSIQGRVHQFRLRSKPLADANLWLARHQAFWENAAQELDQLLSKPRDDE
jgi:DNA-binding transcriptional ArsR family regulator